MQEHLDSAARGRERARDIRRALGRARAARRHAGRVANDAPTSPSVGVVVEEVEVRRDADAAVGGEIGRALHGSRAEARREPVERRLEAARPPRPPRLQAERELRVRRSAAVKSYPPSPTSRNGPSSSIASSSDTAAEKSSAATSVGDVNVRCRVRIRKSLRFSLTRTPRARRERRRKRCATVSAALRRYASISLRALTSTLSVRSELRPRDSRAPATARKSSPCASAMKRRPSAPSERSSQCGSHAATSPIVCSPSASRRAAVFGPAPQRFFTGCGASQARASSGGTIVSPSGLRCPLATFATYFVPEIPTEAVRPPVASRTAALSLRPIASGAPNSLSLPVMSRNASSRLSASTLGEKSLEQIHDDLGHLLVALEARRDDERLRAQPARARHRHRTADAERARLVARRQARRRARCSDPTISGRPRSVGSSSCSIAA